MPPVSFNLTSALLQHLYDPVGGRGLMYGLCEEAQDRNAPECSGTVCLKML